MITKLQRTMLATSFVLTGISSIANDSTKVATAQNSPSHHEVNLENIVNDNKYLVHEETTPFQIKPQLLTYEDQITKHIELVEKYVKEYSSFDNKYSSEKELLRFSLGVFTQESRLQQIKPDGTTIQSMVEAKGVGQFRKLGLLQVNNYLNQRTKIDSNYSKIPKMNYSLAISPTPKGAEENIRAGIMLLKVNLEKFEGNWKLAAAEYNMGMTKLNKLRGPTKKSFEEIYSKLPNETKTYVERIENYMNSFENLKQYEEKLIENYAFGLIAKNNVKGNKATDLSYQKEQYFTEIIKLNECVQNDSLFSTGNKFNRLIAHAKYELGRALYKQGKYELAEELLTEAKEKNPQYSYEQKGANYLLRRLEEKVERMNLAEVEE